MQRYGTGPRPQYNGFSPEQRFFLNWAQLRRQNIRPEALRQQIQTDPHSPGQYRTIRPIMNIPQFQEAFAWPASVASHATISATGRWPPADGTDRESPHKNGA